MKKLQLFVFVLTLVSCKNTLLSSSGDGVCNVDSTQLEAQSESDQTQDESAENRPCIIPDQIEANKLSIKANLLNLTPEEKEKMYDAFKKLQYAMNSKVFKEMMIDHEYNGTQRFYDNNNQTNIEIYQTIMDGSESLNPGINHTLDLEIEMYYSNNSVIGYTYPNVNKIWVNRKFFKTNSPASVAQNIFHEWTHKLGYSHDFNRTTRRNYSVPYGAGTIIKTIISRM